MAAWAGDTFQHDTEVIVGDTWVVQFTLEDSADVAHDLTGVTGTAKVRPSPSGDAIATPTVTITTAASGEWEVEIPAATTANLTPGPYRWAARLTWTDGTVKTVVEGVFIVRRGIV